MPLRGSVPNHLLRFREWINLAQTSENKGRVQTMIYYLAVGANYNSLSSNREGVKWWLVELVTQRSHAHRPSHSLRFGDAAQCRAAQCWRTASVCQSRASSALLLKRLSLRDSCHKVSGIRVRTHNRKITNVTRWKLKRNYS